MYKTLAFMLRKQKMPWLPLSERLYHFLNVYVSVVIDVHQCQTQNEEFQESRVHYTLAGIKLLLKIGEGEFLGARGGFQDLWNPPLATPLHPVA